MSFTALQWNLNVLDFFEFERATTKKFWFFYVNPLHKEELRQAVWQVTSVSIVDESAFSDKNYT